MCPRIYMNIYIIQSCISRIVILKINEIGHKEIIKCNQI